MINPGFFSSLSFVALPVFALLVCAFSAYKWPVGSNALSRFQHIAAGVVTASVTLELVPVMLKADSASGMATGYVLGVMCMLAVQRYAERIGEQLAICIDLLIDGFLLMIGFAAGEQGGLLLLLGLTLETTALGFIIGPGLAGKGLRPVQIALNVCGFALAIVIGAALGSLLPQESGFQFAALLGFGVAALLYLVVEELLAEAHEIEDSPFTTALFFVGFLIPLVLVQLS